MSTLKENQLSKRNKLSKPRGEKTQIDFSKCMNSIDVEEDCFINYIKSNMNKTYNRISDYYYRSLKGDCDFLDFDFKNSDYSDGNSYKNEKIKRLIEKTTNITLDDYFLVDLIKYKNVLDTGIQFFIKYDKKDDVGIIYLIDLYHLAIPTDNYINGRRIRINKRIEYQNAKRRVGNKVNLSEILKKEN